MMMTKPLAAGLFAAVSARRFGGGATRWLARWLTAALCLMLTSCGGGSDAPAVASPPGFGVQPVPQAVVDGSSVTFTVSVTGSGVTLQWQRSIDRGLTWQPIAGAIAVTYTIAVVDATMNGYEFRVAATAGGGTVFSSPATLTVQPPAPPAITMQPADVIATAGADANFAVTAAGTLLSYQWQTSPNCATWTNIAGATQATLVIRATTTADNGLCFRVHVSNAGGSIDSVAARLTVNPPPVPPTITGQPAAANVLVGQTASFSVTAVGTPPLSYRWQVSTDGGATYSDIAGGDLASYTTPATQTTDNDKRFHVVVSNSVGNVTSNPATLTVAPGSPPVVTLNPVSRFAYLPNGDFMPSTGTFTAAFSGTPTPTLQWQVSTNGGQSFTNVNGATAASYTTPTVTTGDDTKQFRLVATNIAGTAATNPALLTVRNAGIGGEAAGLGIRPDGEIVAAVHPFARSFTVPNLTIPNYIGIRTVTAAGRAVSLAGNGSQGHADGTGAAATFYWLRGLVLDSAGNAYVTDANCIRKITPAGVVTTIAGVWNQPGFIDDTGALARFNTPLGITIDTAGNLYVVDSRNSAVRKITPAGAVSTVAGGTFGTADGTGAAARFTWPVGITVASNGDLIVADSIREGSIQGVPNICLIRRVTQDGVVTTMSGPTCGGLVDGPLGTATFDVSWGMAADAQGNLFVADTTRVRMISPAGIVSTLTGSITGPRYVSNGAIAVDAAGNVYVHNGHPDDTVQNLIRKIAPDGTFALIP